MASIVGTGGPVGFVLQIRFLHVPDATAAQLADLTARAEVLARQATAIVGLACAATERVMSAYE